MRLLAVLNLAVLVAGAELVCASDAAKGINAAFVEQYCHDCHNSDTRAGNLDLTQAGPHLADPDDHAKWVRIFDRVNQGAMPPADAVLPGDDERAMFVEGLEVDLIDAEMQTVAVEGRATRRRMNRYEYENTLRDLLGIPVLEIREFLPEDSAAHGFNKVGEALDVSHVQLARYLQAADYAVRQSIVPQPDRPEEKLERYYSWDARGFRKGAGPTIRKTFRLLGGTLVADDARRRRGRRDSTTEAKPPEHDRETESTVIVISTYEPTEIQYNSFRAPVTARYRLRFSGFTVWMSPDFDKVAPGRRPEPVTIYSDRTPSMYRKLGMIEFGTEPTVCEMDVWMIAGETIRPDASRLVRCRPPDFRNPFAEDDGMPGVAFQWMEVEGPLFDEWPPSGHKLLFDDLTLAPLEQPSEPEEDEDSGRRRRSSGPKPPAWHVVSDQPEPDAERLLRQFMDEVYRCPYPQEDFQRFLNVSRRARQQGFGFQDAMVAAYTAVLSSPAFLYFDEQPGPLSDYALADRLSCFLWNTRPDDELIQLAVAGELNQPEVLRDQTERLLRSPRSRQFVNAFLDYWLDLRHIEATSADVSLYPDYDLDDLLVESLRDETQLYFAAMLERDLGVSHLIDSDFSVLNERLGVHYDIPGIVGFHMRPEPLPDGSVRGGLLTQGAVLKVTANGTTTSPVVRGAWVMSRLLGKTPPPPPAAVPAVEPDTQGATTIREQLARHRSIESCNVCHRHIDPVGFALENFDVLGGWRQQYRSVGEGEEAHGIGHNGQRFRFKLSASVDPSGTLPDGQEFSEIRELKACLLRNQKQIAKNMVQQFAVYATGAPIRFSDREQIDRILTSCEPSDYGLRTIIHKLVQSDLFRKK